MSDASSPGLGHTGAELTVDSSSGLVGAGGVGVSVSMSMYDVVASPKSPSFTRGTCGERERGSEREGCTRVIENGAVPSGRARVIVCASTKFDLQCMIK